MKKVIFVLVVIIFILIVLLSKSDKRIKVEFDKCVDGDTAWFIRNNKSKKYRFLSIDTMELDTEYGKITSDYVCDLLRESNIEIEYSSVGERNDKYNRELVFVYINNELLQEKLVEEGYARVKYVYAKYEYIDRLLELESKAQTKRKGIWKDYINEQYNEYYEINTDFDSLKVLRNNSYIIDNPNKFGCRFIGWKNNGKLFDMSTKINRDYNLLAEFDC